MKSFWTKIMKFFGWSKKVPVIPDIIKPKPTEPDAPVCGCKDGVRLWPLAHMGSPDEVSRILGEGGYECGGNPQDIRIQLCKPSGGPWVYKFYFAQGVKSIGGNYFTGLCFDNPHGDGRYHFIGWSKSDLEKDMIKEKTGNSIRYEGTMFFYWELRAK